MNKRLKKLTSELNFYKVGDYQTKEAIKNKLKNENVFYKENCLKRKTLRISFAAVALIILLTMAAIATALKWDEKMLELFKPTEKMTNELSGAVNIPLATAENNEVKITIRQTLADKHGIYVLYDIEAKEGFEFTDDIHWEFCHLFVDYKAEDKKPGMLGGGASQKIVSQEKNKRTALIYRYGKSELMNQKIRLTLKNLVKENFDNDEYNFEELINCEISLEWDFSYVDSTKTIEVNKPVKINSENKNIWEFVDVSPMLIYIQITGDDVLTGIEPKIEFTDGSVVNVTAKSENSMYPFSNFQNGNNKKGTATILYRFDNITDPQSIKSITIGNTTAFIN